LKVLLEIFVDVRTWCQLFSCLRHQFLWSRLLHLPLVVSVLIFKHSTKGKLLLRINSLCVFVYCW
jgi:hypothetical protein